MPRRYIGSTNCRKIETGYRGSVSSKSWKEIFNKELQENPQLFKTRILQKFDTRDAALNAEYDLHIRYDVVKSDKYINMANCRPNGFFGRDVSGKSNPMYGKSRTGEKHLGGENISAALTQLYASERGRLISEKQSMRLKEHNPWKGQHHTEETKQHMSDMRRGENNGMYGKTHTTESRKSISDKRKQAFADGTLVATKTPLSDEQKEKMRIGRSKESSKQKLRNIYEVNGVIVDNAQQYCSENNLNYIRFTQSAKHNIPYNDLTILTIKQRKCSKKNNIKS